MCNILIRACILKLRGKRRQVIPYISGLIIVSLTAFIVSTVTRLHEDDVNRLPESSTRWYFKPSDQELTARYFKLRKQRYNTFNHTFIEHSRQICGHDEVPYLVIISLTTREDIAERKAIRETWGKAIRGGNWPGASSPLPVIKHIFIYGQHETESVTNNIKSDIQQEIAKYGDIVIVAMKDTYRNLTTKVLLGLKWVKTFCPGARYILKADQDAFVHIPNLVRFLQSVGVSDCADIYGTMLGIYGRPVRYGKWLVSQYVYPFNMWPPYTSGTGYVISGKVMEDLLTAAEFMPLVPVEDAFITGILREVLGARLSLVKGFPARDYPPPATCSFHNTVHMVATNVDSSLKRALWAELQRPSRGNCFTPRVWLHNNVSFDEVKDKPYVICN